MVVRMLMIVAVVVIARVAVIMAVIVIVIVAVVFVVVRRVIATACSGLYAMISVSCDQCCYASVLSAQQ
jgi:hypothetical protein